MKKPAISVVLPVYNGELFIEDAVRSVLNQSFIDFELIIIDDGSRDSSLSLIESFQDKRIKIISRENKGLIYSLNEGISVAQGEFIVRMDADDICFPNRFKIQYEFMINNPSVGVVGGYAQIIDDVVITSSIFKHPVCNNSIKAKLFIDSPFIHPSVMLRKSLLIGDRKYSDIFYRVEDFGLWVSLKEDCSFANIPENLIYYRVLPNSETRLGQKDSLVRHRALKEVFRVLFNQEKISYSELELDNYTYSMYRANFHLINLFVLESFYRKILSNIDNNLLPHLRYNLSIRWAGVLFYRRKISDYKYWFFSKESYKSLTSIIKYNLLCLKK